MQNIVYNVKVISLDCAVALDKLQVNFAGSRIFVSTADRDIYIRLNERENDGIPLKQTQSITAPFERFFVTAASGSNIVLIISDPGEIKVEGFAGIISSIDSISNVEKTSNATHNQVAMTATVALIVAANTSRKSVVVQNMDATDNLYVGKSNATTISNGIILKPGQSLTIDRYTGALYGICEAGKTVTSAYFEEG